MQTIGRYQLHEKLGQGGMGTVYRAFDTLLERVVAVKVISRNIDESTELRERFFREARAAGQLSHKNIITIYDLGEVEGQPYLAMEYLEGEDLQRRLGGPERMSLAHKLDLAIELCEGLEYAHARGIVHRDIKPANIFITDRGTLKILDFGLARLVTSELTNSNMMMGTLNYMAPEQVRGERADNRSDIFSVGVVLYELLGGRKAFEGDSFASTIFKILQEVPQPLSTLDASLPLDVTFAVERALAKPRDERYQSIGEMLRDVLMYRQQLTPADAAGAAGRRPSDPPRAVAARDSDAMTVPSTPAGAVPAPVGPIPTPVPALKPGGSVWPIVAAVASLIAVIGVGLLWVNGRQRPTVPSQEIRQEVAAPPAVSLPQPSGASPVSPAPPPPAATPTQAADQPPHTGVSATSEAMRRAAAAFAAQDYAAAQRYAEEVLRRDPSQREALRLRERSRTAVARERDARRQTPAERPADAPRPTPPQAPGTTAQPVVPPPTVAAPTSPAPAPPAKPSTPGATQPPPGTAAGAAGAPPLKVPESSPVKKAPADDPTVRADDAIADLLGRYRSAIETRDLDALRRIWPTLAGDQLDAIRAEFQHARRIDVEVLSPRVSTSGAAGTASFIRRYALMTTDGQVLRTDTRTTMSVRRTSTGWVIDTMHFETVR